jgi:hypothetical protein
MYVGVVCESSVLRILVQLFVRVYLEETCCCTLVMGTGTDLNYSSLFQCSHQDAGSCQATFLPTFVYVFDVPTLLVNDYVLMSFVDIVFSLLFFFLVLFCIDEVFSK